MEKWEFTPVAGEFKVGLDYPAVRDEGLYDYNSIAYKRVPYVARELCQQLADVLREKLHPLGGWDFHIAVNADRQVIVQFDQRMERDVLLPQFVDSAVGYELMNARHKFDATGKRITQISLRRPRKAGVPRLWIVWDPIRCAHIFYKRDGIVVRPVSGIVEAVVQAAPKCKLGALSIKVTDILKLAHNVGKDARAAFITENFKGRMRQVLLGFPVEWNASEQVAKRMFHDTPLPITIARRADKDMRDQFVRRMQYMIADKAKEEGLRVNPAEVIIKWSKA